MSDALTTAKRRLVYHTGITLGARPAVYYPAVRVTRRFDSTSVARDTELVVEGYPRSANSTTVHGILERQPRPLKIAHHKHHAAQLVRAARWGIPAIALVRPPRDAILSFLALAAEARARRGETGDGALTFEDAARGWRAFHLAIRPVRDELVLAPFAWVTRDLAGVIEATNRRYGLRLASAPVVRCDQPALGWHARGNPLRAGVKERLAAAFDERLAGSPTLARLLAACEALHAELVADAERPR